MASILIAEDDMPMRAVMTRLLENAGHKVRSVSDGMEAIAAMKSRHCDLLLTDIVMPGLDGMQLAKAAWEVNPDVKVMFVTGFASVAKQDRDYPKDKVLLLSKPFNLHELVAKVASIIDQAQAAPEEIAEVKPKRHKK
ncbi:MAG: response regulator [Dongiaceae bacterium]